MAPASDRSNCLDKRQRMTAWQFGGFLLCVVVATLAQSITGFALALILLGLVGVFELVPLADAANVATVLTIANAIIALPRARNAVDWAVWKPTAAGGTVGIVAGVTLLGWLSTNTVMALRLLLGITVAACAFIVLLQTHGLARRSSSISFQVTGLISGLLGGLFAASGPPLVYQYYRQPMSLNTLRDTLVASNAFLALLRLVVVLASGQFGLRSFEMCLAGLPIAMGTTWWVRRHVGRVPRELVLKIVCALLLITGVGLVGPAVTALFLRN